MHPSPTHPRRPRSLWHLSHSLIRPCPTLVLGLHLARTASVTVQHLPVLGQATTLVIHSPSYALLGDNRGWIYTLSDDDQCTVDSNLGTDSEARGLLHTYAHTHTYIHTYIHTYRYPLSTYPPIHSHCTSLSPSFHVAHSHLAPPRSVLHPESVSRISPIQSQFLWNYSTHTHPGLSSLSWLITPRGLHDIRCSDYSVDPNQAVVGASSTPPNLSLG